MSETKIIYASSYQEAVDAERAFATVDIKTVSLKLIVNTVVFSANLVIVLLERLWFKQYVSEIEPKNIVIYTVGTLGDSVLLLPSIAAIRRRFVDSTITVITNCDKFSAHAASSIFKDSPHIDNFIAIPDHPVQRVGRNLVVNFQNDSKPLCDMFVNLSPFGNRGCVGPMIREMFFAKWLGAKWVLGFKMSSYKRCHYFDDIQHYFVKNEARRGQEILKKLGLFPIENEDLLNNDPLALNRVRELLATSVLSPPIAVLNPGAKLAASHWPAERFGELAVWLSDTYGMSVVINGTEGENTLCERVKAASGGRAINLAGKLSIQDLVELLRIANICITNNTGPMTLAANIGLPTVVITGTRFSPTFFIPVSNQMITVFNFSSNRYSYDDSDVVADDLLNIVVADITKAVQKLLGE